MYKKVQHREPFREPGTILNYAWECACKGIAEQQLVNFIRGRGADPARILRQIKKGHKGSFVWDVDDTNGFLRVKNVRITSSD
jgi:hypothetical protein